MFCHRLERTWIAQPWSTSRLSNVVQPLNLDGCRVFYEVLLNSKACFLVALIDSGCYNKISSVGSPMSFANESMSFVAVLGVGKSAARCWKMYLLTVPFLAESHLLHGILS